MSSEVLFYMWAPFRQSLIDGHRFYVQQARKRLLSQFKNISDEADKAASEWLDKNVHRFDPDRHDPGDFEERAHDAGIDFYESLRDLREQTYLSVTAGLFHQWEKQLRDWLAREVLHWHHGDRVKQAIWRADVGRIGELMSGMGWPFKEASYFGSLDACRLVVNAYKHGEGDSLDQLKRKYPEYLDDPFTGLGGSGSNIEYLDHTQLRVTDAQLQAFSDAIVAFWQDLPERISNSEAVELPRWFEEAIAKDRGSRWPRESEREHHD